MNANESYGLEQIQASLLQAILKFDEICRKNGIYYSLHGGTLLGAERNHKFIPWDDDVDVSMKRSEYRKFQNVVKHLPMEFELSDDTIWIPRFVMRTETDVVFVDIFIWDYISSNRIAQKLKIMILRFFQGIIKTRVEYESFGLFNRCMLFITHILGKLIPRRIKLRLFHFLCENSFVGNKKCIHRSNDSFLGVSYIFDSDYMDDYKDIEFEKHLFMVNKRYREFLERSYGLDYLTPPPKEKRIPEHEATRKEL